MRVSSNTYRPGAHQSRVIHRGGTATEAWQRLRTRDYVPVATRMSLFSFLFFSLTIKMHVSAVPAAARTAVVVFMEEN